MAERMYKDFLEEVKASAPNLSHREAQKKASLLFQNYKAEIDSPPPPPTIDPKNPPDGPKEPGPSSEQAIDVGRCLGLEKEIRLQTPTINHIQGVLNGSGVTGYKVHEAGKDGANTKVFVTAPGLRIPVEGYFLCFIAR